LGIIVRSDLSRVEHIDYTVQKAWRAPHFIMHIVKRININIKSLAYTSCWDPYRKCQVSALRVQIKTAEFAHHTRGPVWEPLVQRRRTARMCALYKAYNGERAWKDMGDRLQTLYYQSRVDHCWKIRSRKIRTGVGKFSFVNRTIADLNRLPEGAIGTSIVKMNVFRKRVRKVYQ
jgi:hypothetical protein